MENPQTNSIEPSSTEPSSTEPPTDLLSLPPELLLDIFTFVGVENFRQDVGRLAVCKKWYKLARPTLLSNICLDLGDLRPRLDAMKGSARTLAAAQQLTKNIELSLNRPAHETCDLCELAFILTGFDALRTLVIRSEGRFYGLPVWALTSFASLHQLTTLEINLSNVFFELDTTHLCAYIRQLPNLKRLRCRLPQICNDLLQLSKADLEELIITIVAREQTHRDIYPHYCSTGFDPDGHNYDALRTSLEGGLQQAVASMRDPKIVRLIHHIGYQKTENGLLTYAFDAVEGRRLFLGTSTSWDADGDWRPMDWEGEEEPEEDDESEEHEQSDEGEQSDEDEYSGED